LGNPYDRNHMGGRKARKNGSQVAGTVAIVKVRGGGEYRGKKKERSKWKPECAKKKKKKKPRSFFTKKM